MAASARRMAAVSASGPASASRRAGPGGGGGGGGGGARPQGAGRPPGGVPAETVGDGQQHGARAVEGALQRIAVLDRAQPAAERDRVLVPGADQAAVRDARQ